MSFPDAVADCDGLDASADVSDAGCSAAGLSDSTWLACEESESALAGFFFWVVTPNCPNII